jgi:hypothetical protein
MGFRQLSLALFFLASASFAQAENVITTVFNVFESTKSNQLLILSAVDGRIYRSANTKENKKFFDDLVGKIVNISYAVETGGSMIKDVRPVNPKVLDDETLDLNYFAYNELRKFAPTELQSLPEVGNLFDNMLNDGDRRRSQCFKRAHMWAYDMWSKLGVYSQKIFIFYTQRYFWLEEFDWWFHVAPLVTTGGVDYVLDGTFMEKPMPIKEWSDFFMKTDKITCPMVKKYQDYEDNHWKKLCVMMKVPMYYLSPLDIENRDKRGIEKNHWVLPELQDARRAFKNYEDSYEGLDTGKMTKTY